MPHDGVLQVNARNPFTATLHQVLGAVHDLDVTFRVDGCNIASAEPALHKRFGILVNRTAGISLIAACHPRPASLQFTHSRPIPWEFPAVGVDDTNLHAGEWQPVPGQKS